MNQELIDMAKQAGWQYAHGESGYEPLWKFAALVAAAERKIWADEFAGMGEWTCVNIIEGKLGETK